MRQVTKQIVIAFLKGKTKKVGNTYTNGEAIWLHRNKIAEKRGGELWISNAGWASNTTKERLNGLLATTSNAYITQRNFQWYLNGHAWNGQWVNPVTFGATVAEPEPEFDLSSVWVDEEGYSRPIYAVWHSHNVATLAPIEAGLNERGIPSRRVESDTEGVYRPNYFVVVRPEDFNQVLTTINQ